MSDLPQEYDLIPVGPAKPAAASEYDMVPGAPPRSEAPKPSPWAAPGMNFLDALAAGAQGASPAVRQIGGGYNYQLAPQQAQDYFAEMGRPQDTTQQVALRDPTTGEYRVFWRNPEMEEWRLTGLGRVLATGAIPESMPMTAAPQIASRSQRLLQDFERTGVSPTIPAVGQGIASGLAANIISKIPIVGGPVAAGAHRTMEETGRAAERLAKGFGAAETPEQAGQAIQSGIGGFAQRPAPLGMTAAEIIAAPTRKSSFAAKSNALFDRFWSTMNADKQVPLDNTLEALRGPMERFPTSPELGQLLTNPTLRRYYDTLAQTGTLTVPEMKEFRSLIGRMLGEPTLVSDIPRADLKAVYGGISKDLERAASEAGPEAMRAFKNANSYYRAGMQRVDQLEPLLKGSPEQAFAKINRAASETGAANAGLLRSLQRSMPDDEWRNVGAAVIRRMGEPTPGAKDVLADHNFSAASFATNWNRLSDNAKDTLFGAVTPGSDREALEALVRVAKAQKNIAKYANPSGTASHNIAAGLVGIAAERAFELSSHPMTTVLGILGSYGASKALMAPGFARWLYQAPRIIRDAPTKSAGVERMLSGLDNLARVSPELGPVARGLRESMAPADERRGQQP